MLRRLPLYPFLLAVWPPLALAAKNPLEVASPFDIIGAAGVGLIATALVFGIAWLCTRSVSAAGVTAAVLGLAFWWFRELVFLLTGSPVIHALDLDRLAPLIVTVAVTGIAYVAARRLSASAAPRHAALNLFAGMLVVIPAGALAHSGIRPSLGALIGPPPAVVSQAHPDTAPDVYILILDSYAGERSLLRDHGFDNSEFLEALRRRGFYVPTQARANYTWTILALASMLNWEYVADLPELESRWPPSEIASLGPVVAGNRTFKSFMARGYDLVFLPSSAWFVREHPWSALRQRLKPTSRSGFTAAYARLTPLPELRRGWCRAVGCAPHPPWQPESAKQFDLKFARLAEVASTSKARPRLVFAHLMLPHEPYVYTDTCEPLPEAVWPEIGVDSATHETTSSYVARLQCVNRKILRVIDTLLSNSTPTPVIVLQSDHGQRYMLHRYPASQHFAQGWFDIFAAYFVPSADRALLYESISPVNAFRLLFGRIEDSSLARLPDHSFISKLPELFTQFNYPNQTKDSGVQPQEE